MLNVYGVSTVLAHPVLYLCNRKLGCKVFFFMSNKKIITMEFKLRANVVMSKNLTVEADNLNDAVKKAQEMMSGAISQKELKITNLYFDEISPIKWMEERVVK